MVKNLDKIIKQNKKILIFISKIFFYQIFNIIFISMYILKNIDFNFN